jgi:transposase-like protein
MELAESMRSLVEEFHQSGMTQKDFAASHDMGFHKINYWVRKLRDEAGFGQFEGMLKKL